MHLAYIGISGREWPLTPDDANTPVFLRENGIEELFGNFTPTTTTVPGLAGEVATGITIGAVNGSLTVVVDGDDTRREFLRDFSTTKFGKLVVDGCEHSPLHMPVRLSKIPRPPDTYPAGVHELVLSLYSPEGLWIRPHTHIGGKVTVTNYGNAITFPTIEWKNTEGQVTLPSGATFQLPHTTETRLLSLDVRKSLTATDIAGQPDKQLTTTLRQTAACEGIAPGKTGVFIVPNDVVVRWEIGLLGPEVY